MAGPTPWKPGRPPRTRTATRGPTRGARRAAAQADATCKKILEGRDENARAAEARDWLDPKHSRNAMWKGLNKKEARELVDRFYGLGAAQVYAVYVPGDDQIRVNMCAEFMVELPADAAARAKVLAAYNEFCSSIDPDFRAATDLGQTYLVIDLDL